jgi:hypothetical protein
MREIQQFYYNYHLSLSPSAYSDRLRQGELSPEDFVMEANLMNPQLSLNSI